MDEEQKWINYIKEYCSPRPGKYEDVETFHVEADKALCLFLRSLGYSALVDEWEKVDKYYS